jgi:hypothetical protein
MAVGLGAKAKIYVHIRGEWEEEGGSSPVPKRRHNHRVDWGRHWMGREGERRGTYVCPYSHRERKFEHPLELNEAANPPPRSNTHRLRESQGTASAAHIPSLLLPHATGPGNGPSGPDFPERNALGVTEFGLCWGFVQASTRSSYQRALDRDRCFSASGGFATPWTFKSWPNGQNRPSGSIYTLLVLRIDRGRENFWRYREVKRLLLSQALLLSNSTY